MDFVSSTLPALLPVLGSATGDTLLLLVKHAGLLINKVRLTVHPSGLSGALSRLKGNFFSTLIVY